MMMVMMMMIIIMMMMIIIMIINDLTFSRSLLCSSSLVPSAALMHLITLFYFTWPILFMIEMMRKQGSYGIMVIVFIQTNIRSKIYAISVYSPQKQD